MQDETQIWTYIPVTEFDVPAAPASDAARGGLLRLWKSLQYVCRRPKREASEEPQWDRPSDDVLRVASPDPQWAQAATALAAALEDDWFENAQPDRPVRVFVGPPGCDNAEVLQKVARTRRLSLLTAPAREALLEGANLDIPALCKLNEPSDEIFVIPHLEHWYLRHEDGLALIRNLIAKLVNSRGRVLVGCDSWAWAFLQHAMGIEDMLGDPLTLAPFDAERLDTWFRTLFNVKRYEFRRSRHDTPIFPEISNAMETNSEQPPREISAVVKSLAAKARGNPSVALALWRASLRTCDAKTAELPLASNMSQSVLWVVPPAELGLAQQIVEIDRLHRFILHAALLHGGVSLPKLVALLPCSRDDVHRRTSALRRASILEEREDTLRVALTAYPAVRHDLHSEGFLTDAF